VNEADRCMNGPPADFPLHCWRRQVILVCLHEGYTTRVPRCKLFGHVRAMQPRVLRTRILIGQSALARFPRMAMKPIEPEPEGTFRLKGPGFTPASARRRGSASRA